MQRIKKLLQSKWFIALVVLVSVTVPLASTEAALFEIAGNTIIYIVSWVLYILLIGGMGFFATLATKLLVYVSQLNNFTDLPVIIEIWQVSRDLTNMAFIPILLVIAFGTLFRLEAYSWKKLLPRLIFAAILVNYSRAIVGFIVDASQIVMLTFVAAIKDAATVGLTSAFQLDKLLQFGTTNSALSPGELGAQTTSQQRLIAILAAGFMLSTMFTAQCIYIVVLVGRLVMIWFLTATVPFRAIASVLPQTERYASQWDETFIRYVTVGVMAIASLWFSMYVASKALEFGGLGSIAASEEVKKVQLADAGDAGAGALDTTLIAGFIIATMMLMLGMKLTQESSSELGSATGKVAAFATGAMFAKLLSYPAGYVNDKYIFAKTGIDLNLARVKDRWAHGLDANKKARVIEGEAVAAQKYREGYLLAGAFGAGDQVAELGLKKEQLRGGIVGNIPLLRNWDRARRAPWILGGRQGKFEKALEEENTLQGEAAENEKAMETIRNTKNLMTNSDFNQKQTNLNDLANAAKQSTFNNKNQLDRSILEDYRARLQQMADDDSLTAIERSNAEAAADKVSTILNKKESADLNLADPEFTAVKNFANITKAIADDKQKAATDWANPTNKNERTAGGAINSAADIEAELMKDGAYKNYVERRDAILGTLGSDGKRHGGRLRAVKAVREKYGSQMGGAGELKLRKLINEAASGITSEDTTELCDGFKDALHKGSGYGPEALAYFDRIAATGNVNDLVSDEYILGRLKEIDPTIENGYSMKGMKALAKLMKDDFDMPEQAVMSTMHRGFQHLKRAGHTFMTEMTEVKNGQYEWRSQADWQNVALIEGRKRNAAQQLANTTRLQLGDGPDYYEEQRFTLENLGTLIAPSLGTDNRVRLNADTIRHLASDPRRYVVVRNKLLRGIKDTTQRQIALKALNEAMRKGQVPVSAKFDADRIIDESESSDAYSPTNII